MITIFDGKTKNPRHLCIGDPFFSLLEFLDSIINTYLLHYMSHILFVIRSPGHLTWQLLQLQAIHIYHNKALLLIVVEKRKYQQR